MTSRYHGDGDCSWREDERRRAPGTERGRETQREGERMSNISREEEREPGRESSRGQDGRKGRTHIHTRKDTQQYYSSYRVS